MITGRSSQYRRHRLLPPEYDLRKEPPARYRLDPRPPRGTRQETGQNLSGYNYVVVLMNGEHTGGRILIAKERNCDHSSTICAQTVPNEEDGLTCSQAWQLDYSVLWSRTAGGRSLITALGAQADRHQNPNHPAAIHNRRVAEARAKSEQEMVNQNPANLN